MKNSNWKLINIIGLCVLIYTLPTQADAVVRLGSTNTATLTSGLVGHWPFDGSTTNWQTNKTNDVSPNALNFSLVSTATTTTPGPGKIGQGFKFTATSYASTTSSTLSLSRYTLSFWLKGNTAAGTASIQAPVVKAANAGGTLLNYAFIYSHTNGSFARVCIHYSGGTPVTAQLTSALAANTWYHITCAFDGTSLKAYVNGRLERTTASGAVHQGTFFFNISSSANGFPGLIDDLRVYNRGLSAMEVAQLARLGTANAAHSNTVAVSNGLTGYWPFDGSTTNWTTNRTNDVSGNNNTGTHVSLSTTTSPTAGEVGQAFALSGAEGHVSVSNSVSNIRSVAFWAKASTTAALAQGLINLTSNTVYISTDSNKALSGTGFTSPLYYIDGVASSTPSLYDANWHHVVVTSAAAITGSQLEFGRANSTLFGGSMDDVRLYSRELSAMEAGQLYASGAAKIGQSNTVSFANGLTGYWPFDGSTTNWTTNRTGDISGGNTALLINTSTTTSPTPGKIGQALAFDGVASYISEPTSVSNIRSVAFWAKASTTAALAQGLINLTSNTVYISTDSNKALSGTGFTSPLYYIDGVASSTPSLYDANWHHVVVTSAAAITGSQLEFGRANSTLFGGSMDDVRLYSRELSAMEVSQLHTAGR